MTAAQTSPMTAGQAVAWFRSHQVNLWGPNVKYVNPFSTMLGRPGEYYCADAVTATLLTAGIDIRPGCPGYFNVGELFNYMWKQPASGHLGFKTIPLGQELPGDVIMYHFNGEWAHVGMVRARSSRQGLLRRRYLHTIEGDTSSPKFPGSDFSAGVTTDRDRKWSDWGNGSAVHIFRPTGYAVPAPVAKPKVTTALPILSKGSKGADVKALQEFLLRMFPAYAGPIKSSGGADGVFGSGTERVVKDFQSRSRLTADGVVGAHTWAALASDGFKH